jgi:hypothetical protein
MSNNNKIPITDYVCKNDRCNQYNTDKVSRCDLRTLKQFEAEEYPCDYYYPQDSVIKQWSDN